MEGLVLCIHLKW